MNKKIIDLYECLGVAKPNGARGYLTCYTIDDYPFCQGRVRPAMLVVGGGGYSFVSEREQEPVAYQYVAKGYQTFVLEYSVAPLAFPTQLIEACMAVAYIKENAKELFVDKEHVCAIGFSAGGHLCGTLATLYNRKEVVANLKGHAENCRPDAVILAYPVLSAYGKIHEGSIKNVTGGDEEIRKIMDVPSMVNKNTPPAFIWATSNDQAVPVESSLLMAWAYRRCDIPVELHIFEDGIHGLSTATAEVKTNKEPVQAWVDLSFTWLKNRGFVIKDRPAE